MTWKWYTPLGFIGFLGIMILLIIYILKPNYQQKIVSGTYVWKRSLKYQKKRIPVNKLRNLLILLCQILIISVGALILAQPFLVAAADNGSKEKIIIVDASASMRAVQIDGRTRFQNAVSQAKTLAEQTITDGGLVTVILAGKEATPLAARSNYYKEVVATFLSMQCTFGRADIDGAMRFSEGILDTNPSAGIVLFTATKYAEADGVEIIDVSDREWNVAILDCAATMEENNYYSFSAQIASYNAPAELTVQIEIEGVNMEGRTQTSEQNISIFDDQPVTVNFDGLKIASFENLRVYVKVNDSFKDDNEFRLYGGTKEEIKVLYVSSMPNPFFDAILLVLQDVLKSRWSLTVKELKPDKINYTGYDFYIFEHQMPAVLPADGVVFLVNPETAPNDSGLLLGGVISKPTLGSDNFILSAAEDHAVMKGITAANIEVSSYKRIMLYNGYRVLMYTDNGDGHKDPILLIKDQPDRKIFVLSFSLNYSTSAVLVDFPILLSNVFNYFFPSTVTDYVYDVDQPIEINARGPSLRVVGAGLAEQYYDLPAQISTSVPGVYALSQTLFEVKKVEEKIFVKIAWAESDFTKTEEFEAPVRPPVPKVDFDLILYFSSALLFFVLAERLLQARDF